MIIRADPEARQARETILNLLAAKSADDDSDAYREELNRAVAAVVTLDSLEVRGPIRIDDEARQELTQNTAVEVTRRVVPKIAVLLDAAITIADILRDQEPGTPSELAHRIQTWIDQVISDQGEHSSEHPEEP